MKEHLQNALRAGIIFGIVVIFLVLIGFEVTAADLIGQFLGDKTLPSILGLPPAIFNVVLFFILIGLWAGASGARRADPDSWGLAALSGFASGAVLGFMLAVLTYIIGSLNASGVRISAYLAQLLPDAIKLYTLALSPIQAALTYFVIMLVSGLAGGLLARGLGRGAWRNRFSTWWAVRSKQIQDTATGKEIRRSLVARYALYGILLLIVFTAPLYIGQYWNYTVGTVGIYVLLGLGLNIVVGMAGLLDLGYVAFFAIGAYTMALLTAPEPHHIMWNFWAVLPIGVVLAATAGILLGIPVLRMRGDYLAIVTLGFGEIIRILATSDIMTPFSGGPQGVRSIGGPSLFGKPFSDWGYVYLILLAILLIIFVTNRLKNSRVGRAWVAMREDETVARAMGINTLKYKLLAFAIGAAFAGLGGALFASRNQFTGPEDHNLMVSINVLSLIIVGGMGSIPGVIAGAFVLKGLPEVLRQLQNYRVVAFGALLVVMMILRPEGLIPSTRRRLEMHEEEVMEPPQPVHPESTDIGRE